MRWIEAALLVFAFACGGAKIPVHSGYKNDKSKPWKKPKNLTLNDKGEAKTEGELSYADFRRARWYQVTLPSHGELTVKLEITPPGDGVNDDFDLGLEVYDPHFRVLARSDLESQEDVGELAKSRQLVDLEPGKYLIHVYLQSRLDSADFLVRAAFKATRASDSPSDFPAQVAFVMVLPQVPISDDTPAGYVRTPPPRPPGRPPRQPPRPPTTPPPTPVETLSARVIAVSVVSGGTKITLGIGTERKAQSGMKARLGKFPAVEVQCSPTSCWGTLPGVTPDQVAAAGGMAQLTP
jgi:hypothetical protein